MQRKEIQKSLLDRRKLDSTVSPSKQSTKHKSEHKRVRSLLNQNRIIEMAKTNCFDERVKKE